MSKDIYYGCAICGSPTRYVHHWLFGYGIRNKADEDKIYDYICEKCHTQARSVSERIHDNPMAEKLSRMYGQALWEKEAIKKGMTDDDARAAFIRRYGISYI